MNAGVVGRKALLMAEHEASHVLALETELAKYKARETAMDSVNNELAAKEREITRLQTERDSYREKVKELADFQFTTALDSLISTLTNAGCKKEDYDPVLDGIDLDSIQYTNKVLNLLNLDKGKEKQKTKSAVVSGGDSDLPEPVYRTWNSRTNAVEKRGQD